MIAFDIPVVFYFLFFLPRNSSCLTDHSPLLLLVRKLGYPLNLISEIRFKIRYKRRNKRRNERQMHKQSRVTIKFIVHPPPPTLKKKKKILALIWNYVL